MIKCHLDITPSKDCYEVCVQNRRCEALKMWESEMSKTTSEHVSDLPPTQSEREILNELMDIMKEYYFTHRYEYDEAWENGFMKCMNLIPNVYMKKGKDK